MQRRDFMKMAGMTLASQTVRQVQSESTQASSIVEKPNVILIIADQRTYGLSKETGFSLDTSPTLDRMQAAGIGFQHNYCTTPVCVPSRTTMITGRWPEAHHVRMNLQANAAFFETDLYQVAKSRGYRTALIGKNHTYLTQNNVDVWREYFHDGGPLERGREDEDKQYDEWLHNLNFNVSNQPSPFPLETQLPFRIVSDTIAFLDSTAGQPFFAQVSIPEPHDPEQVPAPYWNMFPPDALPDRCAGPEALVHMGPRAQWEYRMQQDAAPQTEKLWRRYRSNYFGALRMIDDQIGRLVKHLNDTGLADNTVVIFTADHGDFLMNYGLGHKGVGLYETLTHTPQIWWGYGIKPSPKVHQAFTSMADIMPTVCEVMGADIPHGVQGRSLWPLLRGEDFPEMEFRSIYSGVGVGGLYYEDSDHVPLSAGQAPNRQGMFDELNKVTQSGNQKMVRMGDWKLVYDMMGYGQLYNLHDDPCEMQNRFGAGELAAVQAELMAELAMWVIRSQDSLPTGPQNGKYETKWSAQHNWYAPYRHGGTPPNSYIP